MKVFISWSGARSKAVAELLSDWIKCVLQAARPWISTRDIDRGALWFSEISDQLKDTTVGVICLTQENKNRPWILFEAGALAKGLSSNRVCTLLVDLKTTDIEDPLAQFNHTLPDRDGLWQLVKTLNASLGIIGLDERILDQVFATYWPQFEKKFTEVLTTIPIGQKTEQRSEKNLLTEILENTRFLNQKVRNLELNIEQKDNYSDYVRIKQSNLYNNGSTKFSDSTENDEDLKTLKKLVINTLAKNKNIHNSDKHNDIERPLK
ncbi:toll/interleukin-1 receptor domain-containing protein [Rhodoferax fermentans]|uniref:Toll-Interleukin receptor n=1 Tax=Rhodoferax fermentans TaxID=28066 RepID=A0A1T1AUT4_RHOFE|nr:toll/interleukin-1 receptor domain-containing protein [Rhodoferax fermentans]MBK1683759.1 toll/interleukin-1 receptor domain-containing protein [Rhodoferax fermentans]OOV07874.1 toll-Interleukin receptor [Rhodoferax fermentans]